MFNQPETKTGLQYSCTLITKEFTALLQNNLGNEALNIENLMKVDAILLNFFRSTMSKSSTPQPSSSKSSLEEGLGLNLVRVCSEAITIAVGKTLGELDPHRAQVFSRQLNPVPNYSQPVCTKYMIPLFQGGK